MLSSAMLSATVLTRDNSRTIADTINSLKGVIDELIIVDDNSTDDTLEIIRSIWPEARIFTRALAGDFAAQRNFSLEQCTHPWAVIIDSDEHLDAVLASAIRKATTGKSASSLYTCWRINKNFSIPTRVAMARPILIRTSLRFQASVHEYIPGQMTMLEGSLHHNAWAGVDDFVHDLNMYSGHKADLWLREKRNYSVPRVVLRQTAAFFYFFIKRYIGERRYRGGWKGFLYCLSWSSEELFAAMKYMERYETNPKTNQPLRAACTPEHYDERKS